MAKFIYVNSKSRVQYVEDSRPTIAGGEAWIEVSNDSVAENWYYDADTQTVSQYQPYNIAQVRGMRNAKLSEYHGS